ncbi:MAG: GmrSD restriction endonuclease domain-containing protein [Clostridium sp.]
MNNKHLSIRKLMRYLNNQLEEGGFWLPNIQRHFVWSEDQIVKLFDSIMREYPIGTLMVWKTKQKIKCRRFLSTFKEGINILDTYETPNDLQKLLVLDGQQRIQSIFIALKGSYDGKELYIDVLNYSDCSDDVKYKFKFLQQSQAEPNMVKVKDIIDSNEKSTSISRSIIKELKSNGINVDDDKREKIEDTIGQITNIFCVQDVIAYQELDSVDNSAIYSENDIVEIFIRANSGGTILEKSDLLFALLTISMEDIEEKLEELITDLNGVGYKFNRDFILKVCLTLIGAGSKYDVDKFRKSENIEKINNNWNEIVNAIKDVKDFLYGKTYIRCDKTLSAYTSLIPIIYLRYKYEEAYYNAINNGLSNWVLKVIISSVYSNSSDSLIDLTIKNIDDNKGMDFDSINEIFKNKNKSLEITEANILSAGYKRETDKRKLYLLFNIWYEKFNFTPTFVENQPNIDHIFPQSALKTVKVKGGRGRIVQKYKADDINQIGNCMLLTLKENGMGGKGDKLPKEWFKDKSKEYLDMHLIPQQEALWELDRYDDFIEARNELIIKKIKEILNITEK